MHARREVFRILKEKCDGIDEGIAAGARLRQSRVLGEQVGLEAANEILEEAGFEFVEKDTDLDSQALRVGSVGSV